MDKISREQISAHLKNENIDGEVIELKDTLGNQQLFRVKVRNKVDPKKREEIKQAIHKAFHTKVTDIQFINENLHFDYNGSHLLVYDIEAKYENIYSAKLQIQIDDNVYGYDILFDDMKGIIEWDSDFNEINQIHNDDGTTKDFKGLIDMFNIGLQEKVNIEHHIKKKKIRKKGKGSKPPKILINFDQAKGSISFVLIKKLNISNTLFSKVVQELSSQSLYVTYEKRENEMDVPTEIFIGKSGSHLSENDMTNLTKVLSKNGIDTTDYNFVNIQDLEILPASALIKTSIKHQQVRNI